MAVWTNWTAGFTKGPASSVIILIWSSQSGPTLMELAVFRLVDTVLTLLVWAVVINAILSWLVAFSVVDVRNRFVFLVYDTLNRLTDPLLKPIRRFMPNLGGVDLSPLVLILLVFFARDLWRGFFF